MYIGTSKDEVRKFVARVAETRQNSTGCSIMTEVEGASFQQDFVNSGLYNLYQEAQRSSTMATMKILMEVLEEYPGFTEYFNEHQCTPSESAPDLPWCDYVGNPAARRFWGLDRSC